MKLLFTILFIGNIFFVKAQTKLPQDSVDYYINETRNILNKIIKDQDLSSDFKNDNKIDPNYINANVKSIQKILINSDKLIKNNPNRIDYYTTKTYFYFISNMYDNFIKESEAILIQAKNNKNNWYNLTDTNKADSQVLLKTFYPYIKFMAPIKKNNDEYYLEVVVKLFETYLPNTSDQYLIKAWVQNKLGKGNLAIESLEKGRKKFPNNLDIIIQLYEYYFSTKNQEKMTQLKDEIFKSKNKDLINQFQSIIINFK